MQDMLDKLGLQYTVGIGEAAFYGPKLDVQIKNVYGKEDTIITVQLDFVLADRFDMTYQDADGNKKRPFIIHRSSIGCYERTLAILIEKYAGAFPLWLAPCQVMVLSITDRTAPDADDAVRALQAAGVLAKSDNRSQTIGYKIRDAQLEKVPYMLVIGDKEKESNLVSVRSRAQGDLGTMTLAEFIDRAVAEIASKAR
jgi:threonyl-tRNA synthetase